MFTCRNYIIFFLTLQPLLFFAQQNILLKHKVKDHILNDNTGIVLVKTSKSVYGIGPAKQEILWENQNIRKLDFNRYSEIPYTPYVFFEDKPLLNSKILSKALNTKGISRAIVDVVTGDIVFNSVEQGFLAVFNTLLLPEQKAVLVDGKTEDGFGIGLFDFETGNQIWMAEVTSDFFTRTKGALLNEEKVLLDADQNIFWLKNRRLLKLNRKTGVIEYDRKGITSILFNDEGTKLYVSSNNINVKKLDQETGIDAFDPKTMESVWPGPPLKVVGNIMETTLDAGELVVITSKGFNILDAESGKKKWIKSDPLPLIRKIVPTQNSYLVVQENLLTLVDQLGHKAWDTPIRITYANDENPIHIFEEGPYALFITPSRANRIEIRSGKKVWKTNLTLFDADFIQRNLKLDIPSHRVWANPEKGQYPVYSENNFYLFNNRDSIAPSPLQEINFGKEFPELKIRENAYFLFKDNKYYYFDLEGKLVYKKEYPEVKSGSLVRRSFRNSIYWLRRGLQITSAAVLFAPTQANRALRNTIVSNNLGGLGTTVSRIYGTYSSFTRGIDTLTDFDFDVDSNLAYVFKRIRKSRENEDSVIVVVSKDDKIEIIDLQIDTGEEVLVKQIDGKRGEFILDDIERVLYFFDGKEISIERL